MTEIEKMIERVNRAYDILSDIKGDFTDPRSRCREVMDELQAVMSALRAQAQAEPIGWTSQRHIDFLKSERPSAATIHNTRNEEMDWTVPLYASPPSALGVKPAEPSGDMEKAVEAALYAYFDGEWPVFESDVANNDLRASMRAALTAAAPYLAPKGWKLVPEEPSDGMIEAGEEEIGERHSAGCGIYASDIFRAMLTAAPLPAAPEGGADA